MKPALVTMVVVLAALLSLTGSAPSNPASGCVTCHEMNPTASEWRVSTHRSIDCKTCHGGTLQAANVRRGVQHLLGNVPDQVRIGHAQVERLVQACRQCHQQQFADWQSGPHGTTYTRIFTDAKHNRGRALMDDCFRCHGMLYEGGVRELVDRTDRKGPWKLKDAAMANQPVIPCLGCHSMHTKGEPASNRKVRAPERHRPSLALFDRRDYQHISVAALPVPAMLDGERKVKMSPDPRQALCYQCHAPLSSMQAGSADDRTPKGVHEGLSCLACHQKHGQDTRASCASCHPRLSNCGLDVEKMDTTFANKASKHNVHFVACGDCHGGKRPVRLSAQVR